ncbi:flagellar hook-associated protein [Clostridium beijerinckii]|nr:flagellar hook-associated protein [Clostridium beijerinckii]
MSTIQRITGTNSGLDVDALVKASLTTYQNKIDKENQNKKVLEYQQEQYKQIMSDATGFYNKYFDVLKTGNLMSTNTYESVSFKSGDEAKVTAKGFAGANVSDYKVTTTKIASKATHTFDKSSLNITNQNMYVKVGSKSVSVKIANTGDFEADMATTANNLNIQLNKEGIDVSAKYSQFSKGIVLESGTMGESVSFEAGIGSSPTYTEYKGTNAKGVITKGNGNEKYEFNQASNVLMLDNVQFSFKALGTDVSLTGTTNVTDLKDKIVKFVEDYNTLLKSINTKIYETRDKDYMPLTDAQKEAMTEDQITAWETKAKTGLLRKDSNLERITSAMKSAMSSVMSGSGLYLENIGINPVKDYTDKNGTFTIDEDKLTKALEENAGNVKDLFTRSASTTDKGGVLTQLAATLKSEFKSSSSVLAKKVGLDGTSTQYNNTLTASIYKKKSLISELNTAFTNKETALYNKYSALETAMQTLNSQQASLTSMLGTN